MSSRITEGLPALHYTRRQIELAAAAVVDKQLVGHLAAERNTPH